MWYKYFIGFSFIFLVFGLYRADYLQIPYFHSPSLAIFSMLFLFGGFIASAISQQKLMAKASFNISIRRAIAMVGLNVFGKYIPGKVWIIMGNALYISEKEHYPVADLSFLLLSAQLISVWCGLVLGICGLLTIDAFQLLGWIGIVIFAGFTLVLFSNKAQVLSIGAVNKFLKKDFTLPVIKLSQILSVLPWFLGVWLLWGLGFYLLTESLTDRIIPVSMVFCFPLAGTIGILLLFSPGGIGVRESVIIGYLTLLNFPLAESITISAVSRLWFLSGEFLMFGTGYFAGQINADGLKDKPVLQNIDDA